MRKYQQLILWVFSFISLILVLVYRHEYNRLHYVLEVFNFFGTPCNFSAFNTTDKYLDHFDWGQSPVWQDNADHYIFSSFANNSCVQAIAVTRKATKLPKKCYLWFENENPTLGEMSSLMIAKKDDLEAHIYYCGIKNLKNTPYAISFGSRSKYSFTKKIILTQMEKKPIPIKATLCVSPSLYNKRELVEFISFHKLIGFKYFIFYYDDIPYSMLRYLSNLREILEIDLTFFPWNFPMHSTELTRQIIEKDCILRTLGKSEISVTLGLNEYLISLDSYGIYSLKRNFHSSQYINIPVQTICIQKNNSYHPIAVQNTNYYNDGSMKVIKLYFNSNSNKTENNVQNSSQLVIHSYKNCEGYSGPFYNTKSINMYSTDFIRSTLMQLLIHDQI